MACPPVLPDPVCSARSPLLPGLPQVMVTRWGNDPYAYGSYSSMALGTRGGEDYDTLAESVGGRVRAHLGSDCQEAGLSQG